MAGGHAPRQSGSPQVQLKSHRWRGIRGDTSRWIAAVCARVHACADNQGPNPSEEDTIASTLPCVTMWGVLASGQRKEGCRSEGMGIYSLRLLATPTRYAS